MNLILASQSPRRRQLLEQMGLSFRVLVADIDETMDPGLEPADEVLRLSREKAQAVSSQVSPEDVVVAADTIVVLDGCVLGKPKDRQQAMEMLTTLSGRTHTVFTGVSVVKNGAADSFVERTEVEFRPLSPQEVEAYVDSGEPMDKAGSYGVQGLGAVFVRGLKGDYFNVMGLPLCSLTPRLRAAGVEILHTI